MAIPGNDTIRANVVHIPTVSTFPYQEDFATGANGWLAGGVASSWALGTPAKNTIMGAASDSNSWVTGGLGTGTYNINENSAVVSPCFDMSNAPVNAWVAMSIWWNSEFSWDGTVLQATTDGGMSWFNIGDDGDPNNWYNDNTIGGVLVDSKRAGPDAILPAMVPVAGLRPHIPWTRP